MDKRFTKIKYDGSKVRLEYEVVREAGDPDEFTLFCADPPAREFAEAIAALADDVIAICELSPSDVTKVRVRGVTLTYSHDVLGACITALKTLKTADAPLVINTPHLPEVPYSEGNDAAPTLAGGTVARLHALIDQAERYLNGDRAQGSLLAELQPPTESVAEVMTM
ncbi:MAG TPA: hypothetical protein VF491_17690 [Vicinamibacterales bacterium]